jgi:TM2 domain-containing membrane protein YozV
MKRKRTALLLNAFVLPGLGQIYLGRRLAGVFIILLVNLLMLLAVLVLLKGLAPIVEARMVSGVFDSRELIAALQSVSGRALALMSGFALLWIVSVVDCLRNGSIDDPHKAE